MKWLIILTAILAAIFSKQIDEAVKGMGSVRKIILVSAAGIVLVTLIPVCMRFL